MNKLELKNYLESKFETVLSNDGLEDRVEFNKQTLNIANGTADDKCYVWIAEYLCMNKKGEKFYFIYYGKKNTTLIFDDTKKTISIRLANNVTKRNQYDMLLKKIKKYLPSSKTYLVFFSCDKVEYNLKNIKSRIIITNEESIDGLLQKYYDN